MSYLSVQINIDRREGDGEGEYHTHRGSTTIKFSDIIPSLHPITISISFAHSARPTSFYRSKKFLSLSISR